MLTFASGPTNSMRGAAFLSGLRDAIVVDVGGTTTDIGVLRHGFPRVAALAVEIGGVRTNFRMPDTISIGLGGGSLIQGDPLQVGPRSVGYELTTRAQVFGGEELTATDVVVAAGHEAIGDASRVSGLDSGLVAKVEDALRDGQRCRGPYENQCGGSAGHRGRRRQHTRAPQNRRRVGDGASRSLPGGQRYRSRHRTGWRRMRPDLSLAEMTRDDALARARAEATSRATAAGADPASVEIVEVEEVPLAYLPGNATRIMVKAVGDLQEGE